LKKHHPQEYTKASYTALTFGRYDYTWGLDAFIQKNQNLSSDSYLMKQVKTICRTSGGVFSDSYTLVGRGGLCLQIN